MQQWQAAQKAAAPAWRLLDTGYRSGALNMGIDEAILLAQAAGHRTAHLTFLRLAAPGCEPGLFSARPSGNRF
jgi:hypothetical protein